MEGSSIGFCFREAGEAESGEAVVPGVVAGDEASEAEIEEVIEEEAPEDVGVDEADKDTA